MSIQARAVVTLALVTACAAARRTTSHICLRDYTDNQCSSEFEATNQQSSVEVNTCEKVFELPIVGTKIYRKVECTDHTLKVTFHDRSGCDNAFSYGSFQEAKVDGCTELGSGAATVLQQLGASSDSVSTNYHMKVTCSPCAASATGPSASDLTSATDAFAGLQSLFNNTSMGSVSWSSEDQTQFDSYVNTLATQAKDAASGQGDSMDASQVLQMEQARALMQTQIDNLRANGGSADDIAKLTAAMKDLQDAEAASEPTPNTAAGETVAYKIVNSIMLAGVTWRQFDAPAKEAFKGAVASGLAAFQVTTAHVKIAKIARRDLSVNFEVTIEDSRLLAASAAASLDAHLRSQASTGFLQTLQGLAPAGFTVTGVTVLSAPLLKSEVVVQSSSTTMSSENSSGLVIAVVVLTVFLLLGIATAVWFFYCRGGRNEKVTTMQTSEFVVEGVPISALPRDNSVLAATTPAPPYPQKDDLVPAALPAYSAHSRGSVAPIPAATIV